ncbi:hypothetical protein KVT40_005046 [Elsinoe batatas]|uniref:Zn(2)-C6 fungal-type domain-containing protein n=1 Tax=Elsinoe batatas TaxID=2601811 RepID=A0A8K0L8A7_9PEZI|nr:hypothetical protein KVT40_005046 [Elsinoe batatas]
MKRARSTKSHGGCARCKSKRMKCDETKPQCRACQRSGAECPGFTPQYRWSRKHEKFSQPTVPPAESSINSSTPDEPMQDESTLAEQSEDLLDPQSITTSSDEVTIAPVTADANSLDIGTPGGSNLPSNLDNHMFDWLDMDMGGFDDLSLSMIQQSLALAENHSVGELPGQDMFPPTPLQFNNDDIPGDEFPRQSLLAATSSVTVCPEGRQAVTLMSSTPAPQRISVPPTSGLLGTFYRLALPSTTAKFSGEDLVNYYFTEVCPLYSCFDGESNPFRTIVGDLWKTSATVYLAIQSMAVATISNHYLYMAPIGHAKKSQAWKSLQLDLRLHRAGKLSLEIVLMGLLLLGLSSPWHRPADLGLKYLFIARNLVQNYLRGDGCQVPMKHEAFFMDALMYWEMLASFVDPVPMMTFPGFGAPTPQIHKDSTQVYPHPWTGIQPEIHFAIAEVGRLLRRRRRQHAALVKTPPPPGQKDRCQGDESWAIDLERYLKRIHVPGATDIADYDDEETPKQDLVKTAQATMLMGLLELYAAFPQRLEKKIGTEPNFSAPFRVDLATSVDHTFYCSLVESWLCAMALHTLQHLQDIAISSSACRSHPLILLSCASQLRLPDKVTPGGEASDRRQEQVSDAREWIEARILALSRKHPQKQQLQILDIIKETWQRLDDKSPNAHWLEVTHDNGWQTMMG